MPKKLFSGKGDFFRNVLTLMTGTTVAQVVPLLASPILRRIFSPEEFGILALYLSVSSLFAIFGTGRYHNAIILPKKKEDAADLLVLCILLGFLISTISLLAVTVTHWSPIKLLQIDEAAAWIYFIPVRVFLSSLALSLESWTIRERGFSKISTGRIIQSILTVSINIFAGISGYGIYALIVGGAIGESFNIVYLANRLWKNDKSYFSVFDWRNIKKQAVTYKDFPIFSLSADIVSTASKEMPILLLNSFFGKTVLGHLSLTQRLIAVPTAIISSSALDVFKERASSEYRTKGNCEETFKKVFYSLGALGLGLFAAIIFFSPILINFIFGEEWSVAGKYAQILSPYFALSFVVSPLTYVFYIAGKQKEDFMLHAYISISVPLSLIVGNKLFGSPEWTLAFYSLNYSFVYLIYLGRSFVLSKGYSTATS